VLIKKFAIIITPKTLLWLRNEIKSFLSKLLICTLSHIFSTIFLSKNTNVISMFISNMVQYPRSIRAFFVFHQVIKTDILDFFHALA